MLRTVFESKWQEVTGGWRILRYKEGHNLLNDYEMRSEYCREIRVWFGG
jgi:hypothetical protein